MKKITKTEMRKNLQMIDTVLNDKEQYEIKNGCVDYKLSLNKDNNLNFIISDEDDILENYIIKIEPTILGDGDVAIKNIIKSIINFIYETEINYRNNYIRKTKNFNNRKIKSLSLWLSRGNTDRVQKINEELVERYNTTKKMVSEVIGYKDYVSDLYSCLSKLYPNWRIEDIKQYIIERFKHFNIKGVETSILDDKLIVQKIDDDKVVKNFEILIDTYSKKNEVFYKVKNELEAAC